MKRTLTLALLALFCICGYAQSIGPALEKEMGLRKDDEKIRVFVIMKQQYDREQLCRRADYYTTRAKRREFVVNELKRFAETSQYDIRISLAEMERNDMVTEPKTLWMANAIYFSATKQAIFDLAQREDVDIIGFDEEVNMIPDGEESKPASLTRDTSITPNVTQVNADQVWDLGYTGQGVVVALIDTGVNYDHLDLKDHLWDGGDEFPHHGWDVGEDDNDPMDYNSHGTHCAGTVCGDGGAGLQTGMAPDVTLMCVKLVEGNAITCSWANICDGIQWAVDHGCDLFSLSFGGYPSVANKNLLRNTCDAALAAGVIGAVAAGNEGHNLDDYPIPANLSFPGGCPPPYMDPVQQANPGGLSCVVCVGNVYYNDVIYPSSSIGPVEWTDTDYGDYPYTPESTTEFGLIRPDVCAPGASIISADYSNTLGYTTKSGTSMATPCVAGCMALMLSKNPELTPADICRILEETAKSLAEGKSNVYGYGRVDALAAVNAVPDNILSLASHVIHDEQGNNNQQLNAGESVTMDMDLRCGPNALNNATLNITCGSEYVTITNGTIALPDFAAGQTQTVTGFAFTVNDEAPARRKMTFYADVLVDGNSVGHFAFTLAVIGKTLVYEVASILNDDNGNGFLEPGETADLRVSINNIGNATAQDVTGTLSTGSEYLTINSTDVFLGDMAVLEQAYADFSVTLSASATNAFPILFTLDLVEAEGQTTQLEFGIYSITTTTNPQGAGTLTGAGIYCTGENVTLSAIPDSNYTLHSWKEGNTVLSYYNDCNIVVSENVNYVANFDALGNVVSVGQAINFSNVYPTISYYNYSLTQQIFTTEDLGEAFDISSIAYFSTGTLETRNCRIYLKHTEKSAFQDNQDWEIVAPEDLLFEGNVTFTVGAWNTIYFDHAFAYDGIHNVVLVVDDNTGSNHQGLACRAFYPDDVHAIRIYGNSTNYDPYNPSGYVGTALTRKSQVLFGIASYDYTVTVSADPTDGGTVSGGGLCYYGQPVTLTATPNNGYIFLNWTKDNNVVSYEQSFDYTVTESADLVAHFVPDANIIFTDANVKAICVAHWDTNGDGELSYVEAAAVSSLGEVFSNKSITSFNELQYFIGLTSIGSEAFFNCSSLVSVIIPSSVTSIGNYAFEFCDNLTSIEIPNSVISIGSSAFEYCRNLTSIEIPNSVTSIGSSAFCGCYGLTSVEIPSSVTSIGTYAFYNCYGLTSLEIPSSVTSIGNYAFGYCNGLNSIVVWAETPPALGDNTAFYNVAKTIPVYVPCGSIESYQDAQYWDEFTNMMEMCSGEVAVTANPSQGGTVTGAGYYNSGDICVLTATANPGYGFANWTENGLLVSRDPVFSFYAHPATVVANFCSDDFIVFADASVKAICVANWDTNGDGELSYAEAAVVSSLGEVFSDKSITSFNELQYFIGLTSIGSSAFYDCFSLVSVIIPGSVTSIGSSAFGLCDNLTSIEIPNSVISIGSYAFEYCRNLTSIEIPNSVTSIGSYAFYYCDNLTSIEIPNSVKSIGTNPFSFCPALEQIIVEEGNMFYDSRDNCNAIINTSTDELVAGCKNTVIPNSVTTIGSNAFSGCTGLTSIEIPNSVTIIGYSAFSGCTGLTSIEIPNSVTSIGIYAFSGCTGLASMTVLAENPPALGDHAFGSVNRSIPVYVPCGSLEAYQHAAGWKMFTNYMPGAGSECEPGEITATANPVEGGVVAGSGFYEGGAICTLTATANNGYSFLYWTENGTKVSYDADYSFWVYGDRDLVANFAEGEACSIVFDLYDSWGWGDGWRGNYLVIDYGDGTSEQLTVEEGSSASYSRRVATGSHVTLTWIMGNWPKYCSFKVHYMDGDLIYESSNIEWNFEYSFDVDCSGVYVTQTTSLTQGWNWWSTYIELSGVDGLSMLEESLDGNGVSIKSQGAFVSYSSQYGWNGALGSIGNESGYKVMVADDCTSVMSGVVAQPGNHPITLGPNWNWIGYPVSTPQSAASALSALEPEVGDVIKGQVAFAIYQGNGWSPASFVMNPGESYMYYSNATNEKTLVFAQGREETLPDATGECQWQAARHAYPDNLSLLATVEVEGEEQRDEQHELGAFVNGECRGSAKLYHEASVDRYIAFLTVTGQDGERIEFRLTDGNKATGTSDDHVTFHSNDIVGSLDHPLPIRFGAMNGMAESQTNVSVYPNPVDRNAPYTLAIPEDETVAEVLVVNALGEVFTHTMGHLAHSTMPGLPVSGVYLVKVMCKSGNVYLGRVVVK